MLYYKVKPEHDGYKINNTTLIANELFTETEMRKKGINPRLTDKIQISQRDIYMSFGARFQSRK